MSCDKEKEALLNIIDLYKDMPYIWQKEHKDYSNKEIRNDGWNVLLQMYKNFDENATVKIIKRKIENMRTTYGKELKKVLSSKHTGAGTQDIYKPSLWYFEAFSFLGSRTESCRQVQDSLDDVNVLSSDEDATRASIPTSSGLQKRKKPDTLFDKQEKLLQSAEKMMNRNEEEWEIFAKSIGYQMKDLEERQLTICQKIISDVIFYAKFNRLSEESHVVLSNEFRHNDCTYYSPSPPLSTYSSQSPLPSRRLQQVHYSPQPSPSRPPSSNAQQQIHLQQVHYSPQPSPSRPPSSNAQQQIHLQQVHYSPQPSPSRPPSSNAQQQIHLQQAHYSPQPSPARPPSSNAQQQIHLQQAHYSSQPSPSRPPSTNSQHYTSLPPPSPSQSPTSNQQEALYSSENIQVNSDEIIVVNSPQDFLEYFPEENTSDNRSLPIINTLTEGPANIMKEFIIFNKN